MPLDFTMDDFLNADNVEDMVDLSDDTLDTFGVEGNTITIPVEMMKKVTDEVAKLDIKAKAINPKLHITATVLPDSRRTEQRTQKVNINGTQNYHTINVELVDVELEYNTPVIQGGDYTYVGDFKIIGGEPLIHIHDTSNTQLVEEVKALAADNKGQTCDQCHTRRKRNTIYVFRKDSTGQLCSLGEECAKAYFGLDVWNQLQKLQKLIDKLLLVTMSVGDSWYADKIQRAAESCTRCGTMLSVLLSIMKVAPDYQPKNDGYVASKYYGFEFTSLPYGLTDVVPVNEQTWKDMLEFYNNFDAGTNDFRLYIKELGKNIAVNEGRTNERSVAKIEWAMYFFAKDYVSKGLSYTTTQTQNQQPAQQKIDATTVYPAGSKIANVKITIKSIKEKYSDYGNYLAFVAVDENGVTISGNLKPDNFSTSIRVGNKLTIKSASVKRVDATYGATINYIKFLPTIENTEFQKLSTGSASNISDAANSIISAFADIITAYGGVKQFATSSIKDAVQTVPTQYPNTRVLQYGNVGNVSIISKNAISDDAVLAIANDLNVANNSNSGIIESGSLHLIKQEALLRTDSPYVMQLNELVGNTRTKNLSTESAYRIAYGINSSGCVAVGTSDILGGASTTLIGISSYAIRNSDIFVINDEGQMRSFKIDGTTGKFAEFKI